MSIKLAIAHNFQYFKQKKLNAMNKKTTTEHIHHLLILDESGSMQSIRRQTMDTFNEIMSHNKQLISDNPDQEHRLSFFTFNGRGIKTIAFNQLLTEPFALHEGNYNPADNTPLWDAIGSSVLKVKHQIYGKPNHNVLVSILTDGAENSSKEFNGKEIKAMIEALKPHNWAFTYIGTDHDIEAAADAIGMHSGNRIHYDKSKIFSNAELFKEMRIAFSERVHKKENLDIDLMKEAAEKVFHKK